MDDKPRQRRPAQILRADLKRAEPAKEDYAQVRLGAAVRAARFLVIEQVVIGVLCLVRWPSGDSSAPIYVTGVFFGLPAVIYGILCVALAQKSNGAAVTLLILVSLHTLLYLAPLAYAVAVNPLDWPTVSLAGALIPMLACLVQLSRSLRCLKILNLGNPSGFQVVLPIDSVRGK